MPPALVHHQLGIDLCNDRRTDFVLHTESIRDWPVETASPGDFAIGSHVDQADIDPYPSRPVLDRAVEHEVRLQPVPGVHRDFPAGCDTWPQAGWYAGNPPK